MMEPETSAATEGRGGLGGEGVILNLACIAMAIIFLGLILFNFFNAGSVISIDSLFFTSFCLLMAMMFMVSPLLTIKARMSSASQAKQTAGVRVPAGAVLSGGEAGSTRLGNEAPYAKRGLFKKKSDRNIPPDVEHIVATMNRPSTKSND